MDVITRIPIHGPAARGGTGIQRDAGARGYIASLQVDQLEFLHIGRRVNPVPQTRVLRDSYVASRGRCHRHHG